MLLHRWAHRDHTIPIILIGQVNAEHTVAKRSAGVFVKYSSLRIAFVGVMILQVWFAVEELRRSVFTDNPLLVGRYPMESGYFFFCLPAAAAAALSFSCLDTFFRCFTSQARRDNRCISDCLICSIAPALAALRLIKSYILNQEG